MAGEATLRGAQAARGLLASLILGVALLVAGGAPAQAHKSSDAYLSVTATGRHLDVRWDIALRDLHVAIGLDRDGDGNLTWGEVRGATGPIMDYALAHLALSANGVACRLSPGALAIDDHTDGAYAVIALATDCLSSATTLDITYRLLFELDAQHRGLVRIETAAGTQAAVFAPDTPRQSFTLGRSDIVRQGVAYLREGVWHIWTGYDHMLFLITLLLPVALIRQGATWRVAERLGEALAGAAAIVTAFTLSHSLTLGLAVFGVIALPSRLVESAIAATVVLAALNNVVPLVTRRLWLVAFGFGLVHGLGFAGVLVDLGFTGPSMVPPLVGFNVGVEVGQIAIVGVVVPALYLARRSGFYRRVALPAGSLGIAGIAALWFAARAFDAALLP